MTSFQQIFDRAAARKGGIDILASLLPAGLKSSEALTATPDDRWLAEMTRAIFKAGFSWKVIDAKWNGFEEAFHGFDPGRCAGLSPDDEDALCRDERVVRNRQKILTVPHNAVMVIETSRQHDGFGRFVADWPDDDFIGLLAYLNRHGSRLGGMTAQYFLRFAGRDGFVLSRDGVAALIDAGVLAKAPSGKSEMKKVQEAYNRWRAESGYGLAAISRILALSIDAPHS